MVTRYANLTRRAVLKLKVNNKDTINFGRSSRGAEHLSLKKKYNFLACLNGNVCPPSQFYLSMHFVYEKMGKSMLKCYHLMSVKFDLPNFYTKFM